MKSIIASGKRKRAVARASISDGSGKVLINKKDYKNLQITDRLKIDEPLRISENVLGKIDFDVLINVRGGGEKSQVESARVALAKAIVEFIKAKKDKSQSKELLKNFLDYDRNLVVADVRRKETYKPGDSKARRKRQKSYR